MSVTSGGTALNPFSRGGRSASAAGTGEMEMVFLAFHSPSSRYQVQMEAVRSSVLTTEQANP